MAEWQQWANLGVQAALCRRLEVLMAADDDAVVANEFRQVMVAWRQASDVSRGEGEALWQRFKKAHDAIHPRAEAYLAKERALRLRQLVLLFLSPALFSNNIESNCYSNG